MIGGAIASLIMQEDWSTCKFSEISPIYFSGLHLSKVGWLVWIAFAFGILLFGNLLQVKFFIDKLIFFKKIGSISNLGAPLVSTLLAFRLVSSLVFSALIMHEELNDVYQFVGAAIVLITVTAYMWFQKRASKK